MNTFRRCCSWKSLFIHNPNLLTIFFCQRLEHNKCSVKIPLSQQFYKDCMKYLITSSSIKQKCISHEVYMVTLYKSRVLGKFPRVGQVLNMIKGVLYRESFNLLML